MAYERHFTRRELVRAVWLALASSVALRPRTIWANALRKSLSAYSPWLLIGDGEQGEGSLAQPGPLVSHPGELECWSPSFGRFDIACPFLPHGIVRTSHKSLSVVAMEKWGAHCASFDLLGKKMARVVTARRGRRFFGHGVADASGRFIFASQMNDEAGEGLLALLDASLEVQKEITTGGAYPHDCQWSLDKRYLVVVNSRKVGEPGPNGGSSSLVWISPRSGAIERKLELGNPEGGYAHFAQARGGEIIVAGSIDARREPTGSGHSVPLLAVVDRLEKATPLPFPADARPQGEALSLALNEELKLVAATFPLSGAVHVWNYSTKSHIRHFHIDEPRALVFSLIHDAYLVSSASRKRWSALSPDMQQLIGETSFAGLGIAGSGSHAFFIS